MKISELTTERAADVLCEITPFIANVTSDSDLMSTLSDKLPKGSSLSEIYLHGSNMIAKLVPIVLKTHRADVFGILSVVNETTVDDISNQNILKTIDQIRQLIYDKELVDFFKSLQPEGAKE